MTIKQLPLFFTLAFFASITSLGCNAAIAPQELKVGAMGADISGGGSTSFLSTNAKASVTSGGDSISVLAIDGSTNDEIGFEIPKQSTLPYTIAIPGTDQNSYIQYCENIVSNQCRTFTAINTTGTFSITITQLKPTVEGSFSATVVQHNPPDSLRNLTNGTFNAGY